MEKEEGECVVEKGESVLEEGESVLEEGVKGGESVVEAGSWMKEWLTPTTASCCHFCASLGGHTSLLRLRAVGSD